MPCFTFQFLLLESFYKFLTSMNKILRIQRYVTIWVIVSLLTQSIFVLGCTTDSISKKNKKSAIMNDPIVTYWYCWWRINYYWTDSSGFELLHRLNFKRLHNSNGTNYDWFSSSIFYRVWHFKTFISVSINHESKLGDTQRNHFSL